MHQKHPPAKVAVAVTPAFKAVLFVVGSTRLCCVWFLPAKAMKTRKRIPERMRSVRKGGARPMRVLLWVFCCMVFLFYGGWFVDVVVLCVVMSCVERVLRISSSERLLTIPVVN